MSRWLIYFVKQVLYIRVVYSGGVLDMITHRDTLTSDTPCTVPLFRFDWGVQTNRADLINMHLLKMGLAVGWGGRRGCFGVGGLVRLGLNAIAIQHKFL